MNQPQPESGPLYETNPKPPKPKYPKPLRPTDNPKEAFKGKSIWSQANEIDGERLFEEIFRRLQLTLGDTLLDYFDELQENDRNLSYRARIYQRMVKS
jgi:hypothetical protein